MRDLALRFGAAPPAPGVTHYSADFGPFRLKWERHTEFARYKFIAPLVGDDPLVNPAISTVPADWLETLTGETMVATHAGLIRSGDVPPDPDAIAARLFSGHTLVGSLVGGGAAVALTDFRIQPDGFGRLLVLDRGLTPARPGAPCIGCSSWAHAGCWPCSRCPSRASSRRC